jgi:hypothetical protein
VNDGIEIGFESAPLPPLGVGASALMLRKCFNVVPRWMFAVPSSFGANDTVTASPFETIPLALYLLSAPSPPPVGLALSNQFITLCMSFVAFDFSPPP